MHTKLCYDVKPLVKFCPIDASAQIINIIGKLQSCLLHK